MKKPKTPKYLDGGKTKSTRLQLSNKDVDNIARYLYSQKDNEEGSPEYWKTQNYIQSLSEGDRGRINSYYNSPQFKKLMDKESGPNINFLMPDKQGKYVDSGVNPFDVLLPTSIKATQQINNDIKTINKVQKSKNFADLRRYAEWTAKDNAKNPTMYDTDTRGIPTKTAQELRKLYNSKTAEETAKFNYNFKKGPYTADDLEGWKKYAKSSIDEGQPYLSYEKWSGQYKNGGLIKYKNGGAADELKNVGLFAADTMLAEWAPNAIKQDQYTDTKFGKQLGNVAAVNESLSSQSPVSKNISKNWNDNKTGYNQTQMDYYKQAQPIAKTGSKIGEMWAGSAMGGVGGSGMMGQMIQGGAQQGLNAQYDPTQNMQWNDPNTQYAAEGGVIQPNAELEKQENVLMPNGQFGQFNGPSHDNGGIPTNLPQGTKVFSDRLKMGKTGKTFAQLNKPNNTTKEDKILEDSKSTSVAKATASLMKLAKQKNSDELFAAQEALKQSKVDRYTMKLGGIVKYPDGGKTPYNQGFIPDTNYSGTNAVGFPVDKFGRKLTPEEMTGFSRPGYSYGKGTVAGASGSTGINPLTGHAYQSLANAGGIPRVTQLGALGTENPTYEQPTNMTDAQFIEYNRARLNLPKQANGGMIKYKPGGTVGEDEPIIQVPGSEPSNLYLGDPTEGFTTGNWRDKYSNTKNLTPDQAAQLDYTAQHPTPDKQRGGIPWGDMLKQGALGIVNNLGNIYDLNRAKDVEKVTYGKLNPALPDETASLREADRQGRIGEYNLRNASVGNSGAYMANEVANRTNTTLTKDKIKREYENMRADIRNRAQEFNIGQQIGEDTVNRQIRGNARNITGNALSNIGTNVMGQYKDSQMTKADMDKIELIKTMYPAIKNNKEMMAYYKAKYPKFNWSEIERG